MGVGPASCNVCGLSSTEDVEHLRNKRNTEDRTTSKGSMSLGETADDEKEEELQNLLNKAKEKRIEETTSLVPPTEKIYEDIQFIPLDIDKSKVVYFTDLIRMALRTGFATYHQVGSVLPGIVGVLWPNSNSTAITPSNNEKLSEDDPNFVINTFIEDLNKFINAKSLGNDMEYILKDIHILNGMIDTYLHVSYQKKNEKTLKLNKALDHCDFVRKTIFTHKRGKYLIPLTLLLAVIDLSLHLEIYQNGHKFYKGKESDELAYRTIDDNKNDDGSTLKKKKKHGKTGSYFDFFDKEEWLTKEFKSRMRLYCDEIIDQFLNWKTWRSEQFKLNFKKHKYPTLYGFTAKIKDRINKNNTYTVGPLYLNFDGKNEKDYCQLFKQRIMNDELMMYHFQCFSSMFLIPWLLPQFNNNILNETTGPNKRKMSSDPHGDGDAFKLHYISYYSKGSSNNKLKVYGPSSPSAAPSDDEGDETDTEYDNNNNNDDNDKNKNSRARHVSHHGAGGADQIDNQTVANAFAMADAEKEFENKQTVLYQEIGPYLLQIKKPNIDDFVALFPIPKYNVIKADHGLDIEGTDLTVARHKISKVTLSMGNNFSSIQFSYSIAKHGNDSGSAMKIDGKTIGTINENSNVNNQQNRSEISGFYLKFKEYVASNGLPKPLFSSQLDSIKFYYQDGSEIVMNSLPRPKGSTTSVTEDGLRSKNQETCEFDTSVTDSNDNKFILGLPKEGVSCYRIVSNRCTGGPFGISKRRYPGGKFIQCIGFDMAPTFGDSWGGK